MNSINIYSYAILPEETTQEEINKYLKHLSDLDDEPRVKTHEYLSLKEFIAEFLKYDKKFTSFNDFYFSYSIPQISKEFDLLKIGSEILNIELKSSLSNYTKITEQLRKNKYYLSHLSRNIHCFTFIADSKKVYTLNEANNLIECDMDDIVMLNKSIGNTYTGDINKLFTISSFLVSPINSPDKFIKNRYFLTSQQLEIKNNIFDLMGKGFEHFYITGNAGTGKTLLLYDIALEATKKGKCLLFHCGITCEGHKIITDRTDLTIMMIKQCKSINYDDYDYIFFDEVHRIWPEQLKYILSRLVNNQKVIYSFDAKQVLSYSEERRKISQIINSISNINGFTLTNKIRTNKHLSSFINAILDLSKSHLVTPSSNIKVLYANSVENARVMINQLSKLGYTFINYTPSRYHLMEWEKFSNDLNSHKVIGQEFDKVALIMGPQFKYVDGKLFSKRHPNPDYIYSQLFYQQVTRVRDSLYIIVYNNFDLFINMLSIFD